MRPTPASVRDRVVLLLAQLLSSPLQFTASDLPDLDVLVNLEGAVMRKVAEATRSASFVKVLPERCVQSLPHVSFVVPAHRRHAGAAVAALLLLLLLSLHLIIVVIVVIVVVVVIIIIIIIIIHRRRCYHRRHRCRRHHHCRCFLSPRLLHLLELVVQRRFAASKFRDLAASADRPLLSVVGSRVAAAAPVRREERAPVPTSINVEAVYGQFVAEFGPVLFKPRALEKRMRELGDLGASPGTGIVSKEQMRETLTEEGDTSRLDVFCSVFMGQQQFFDLYDILYTHVLRKRYVGVIWPSLLACWLAGLLAC